jgi:RTX calcium-binding nonapeptide repeat (4 copies)
MRGEYALLPPARLELPLLEPQVAREFGIVAGVDSIAGDPGDDTLFGNFGSDVISGGPGDDFIDGDNPSPPPPGPLPFPPGGNDDNCAGGPGDDLIVNCETTAG